MSPDDRDWYVEQVIASDHEFHRDGFTFVEYAVRVHNYAERKHPRYLQRSYLGWACMVP